MISKKNILTKCLQVVDEKITTLQLSIKELQEDANNETKSSMGDKYETGKAMIQRERDLKARQLAEFLNMKKTLVGINMDKVSDTVELGALVKTNAAYYFIAVSLGLVEYKGEKIMSISAIAPIAQAMLGKNEGDEIEWQGKRHQIVGVV